MKFLSTVAFFLSLSNAVPSKKGYNSSIKLGDLESSGNKDYCAETFKYFSDAKKDGRLKYRSGQLDITIAPKDLFLIDKEHKINFFLLPTFSYVLAKWYNNQFLNQDSPIKVSLNFKKSKSKLEGTRDYIIGLKPISEPYVKKEKYHVIMSENVPYRASFFITAIKLERGIKNWETDVMDLCKEETEESKPEGFCKVVLNSNRPISELPKSIVYNPTEDLVDAWSKC